MEVDEGVFMSKYYVNRNYTAKEMARANISKKSKKSGGFFSTLKFIFILIIIQL